jgi:hypothetical protein
MLSETWWHRRLRPLKLKRGKYRPVNQAGFRSIFAGPLGAKPRRGKYRKTA